MNGQGEKSVKGQKDEDKRCGQQQQLGWLSCSTATQHQNKRNSFHGFCNTDPSSASLLQPPCPWGVFLSNSLAKSMANGGGGRKASSQCHGTSLLQLVNNHGGGGNYCRSAFIGNQDVVLSASNSPSSEPFTFTSLSPIMLRPKYSLNLRPEDGSPHGGPPRSASGGGGRVVQLHHHQNIRGNSSPQSNHQQNPQSIMVTPRTTAMRSPALCQNQGRQPGSTDSAPASAASVGGGERLANANKRRKELWALMTPAAFHQSFDMRSPELSSLSNSCGHIASGGPLASSAGDSASGDPSGASCYRSERRSAFCSGGTSRDHGRHTSRGGDAGSQHQLMFCTAPACSGHTPCNWGHRAPPIRSAQSSFDSASGEPSGQLRDTYLTEISREWMRMNGAIAPFKNILQQASSVASTPLPHHRTMGQTPAVQMSAAAAAATTAAAILSGKAATEVVGAAADDLMSGNTVEAIQGSCHNLATVTAAATTDHRIVEQIARQRETPGAAEGGAGSTAETVIIIEPRTNSQQRRHRTAMGQWAGGRGRREKALIMIVKE